MNKEEFISRIAHNVVKIAPEFDIKVCSPVIAQAILESGWGTTDKAQHNNFFGIKYQPGRVPSASGYFSSNSYEQKPDGTYYPITCMWCEFATVEDGVRGYFEFIDTPRYENLKGVRDPRLYLERIRADGYATSLKYVDSVMRVIENNGLTKYDPKSVEVVSNYAARGNYGSERSLDDISYIVIHYTANDGDSAEGNGNYFARTLTKSSAHYFVDDNRIIQSVPDNYVAWSVGGKKWSDCVQTGGGKLYGIAKNQNSISIELCDTVKNGIVYPSELTIQNAAFLTVELMNKYNIPSERVIRHFDVNGKHCPSYWMDDNKWNLEFKSRLGGVVVMPTIYRVQSGAFKSKLNAEAYKKKLSKAGFESFITETCGYYKVQCGAYSVRANAEAQKNRLLQKGFAAIIVSTAA